MKKIFILSSLIAITLATPSFATPTELDKKTVASKAYVDTKQDIIETGLVSVGDDWFENLPSVVSFDSTSGLVGNKYGILDLNGSMNYIDDGWNNYIGDPEVEYLIPTVGAVAREVQMIWDSMPYSLTWDSAETTSTNAYETKFVGDTGATANAWPSSDRNKLINTAALAQGLALKQNKLPEQDDDLVPGQQFRYDSAGKAASVLAPTTAGNVTQVALWDADALDVTAWNINEFSNDNAERSAIRQSIPTVGAVEVGLNNKQDQITTGLVTFREPEENIDYTVPALVSYGTGTNNADGVLGNKIGILGLNVNGGLGSWEFLNLFDDSEAAYLDNFVPTVRAVASELGVIWNKLNSFNINSKQDKLPAAWTSATSSTSMGANANYSGGQTIELNTLGSVKRRYIAGIGSQPLTKKSGGDNLILYVKGKKTLDAFEASNFGGTSTTIINTNKNYIKGALVSLELLKDTYSALIHDIPAEIYPVLDTSTTDWAHMAPSVSYVGGQIMTLSDVAGVAERRYIAPATGNAPLTQKTDADGVILYINGTKTPQEYRISNFGNSSDTVGATRFIRGALVTLGLLRDVYSELNTKITNNALPTGTTGTVVTYNGTNATTGVQEFGERAVYDPANTYNASTDATKLATMASVKYVCGGYEPAAAGQPAHDGTHPGDEDYCWLWVLPN